MLYAAQSCIFLAGLTALITSGNCQSGEQCPSIINRPSCVCNHPDGKGIIDASSFGLTGNEAPRFKDLVDPLGYSYTYNPCYPYHDKLCNNVHMCQTSNFNPDVTFTIADAGTEEMFIDPDGIPYIFYTGPGRRTVYVYLHCDRDKKSGDSHIITDGDIAVFFEYIFHLHSCDACPGGCHQNSGAVAGPIGIVLIVLIMVGVAVYFIMGVVVMKVKYDASGVDLIPNRTFWMSIPGLIKDGTLFTFSPCIKRIKKEESYSEMK